MELCCARTTCDGLGGRSEIKRTHQLGLRRLRCGLFATKRTAKKLESASSANFFYMWLEILHLRWSLFRPQPHTHREREMERKRQFAKAYLFYAVSSVCEKEMKLKAACEPRDFLDLADESLAASK